MSIAKKVVAKDTVRPTASIMLSDYVLAAGERATVTIRFSEAVKNFTLADLTAENGTLTSLTSKDGVIWTALFTPTANVSDTSNVIRLGSNYSDLAGNLGAAASSAYYAVDTKPKDIIRPTASIALSDQVLGVGEKAVVTIKFSEAVKNFTLDDLTAENGTLSGLYSKDSVTWTAVFTPMVKVSDTSNLIWLGGNYSDLAGNAGTAISSANYTVDTKAPTVSSIKFGKASLYKGESSDVTITFSERVEKFDVKDIFLSGGSLTSLKSIDGGLTWKAVFTVDKSAVIPLAKISVLSGSKFDQTDRGYYDLAGNLGGGYREDILSKAQGGNSDAQWVVGMKHLSYNLDKVSFGKPEVALKYAAYQQVKLEVFASSNLSDVIENVDTVVTAVEGIVDLFKTFVDVTKFVGDSRKTVAKIFDLSISVVDCLSNIIYDDRPGWVNPLLKTLKLISSMAQGDSAKAYANYKSTQASIFNEIAGGDNDAFVKAMDFVSLAVEKIIGGVKGGGAGVTIELAAETLNAAVKLAGAGVLHSANSNATSTLASLSYLDAYYASNGNSELMKKNFKVDGDLNKFLDVVVGDGWFDSSSRKSVIEKTIVYANRVESVLAAKFNDLGGVAAPSLSNNGMSDVFSMVNIIGENSFSRYEY